MKKLMLVNLCALTLIFMTAGAITKPDTDSQVMETLLKDRICVLNYYYGGKMSYADAKRNIEKLAAGQLLKEDIRLMKAYDGDWVDQVADFHIDLLECRRSCYGLIKGTVDIYWLMQGENGRWETEESYYFTAEDDQGVMKLTQLKKL